MIRYLRAAGYVVIPPDEVEAVDDQLSGYTCGCNTMGVLEAQAAAADPREITPVQPGSFARAMREFLGVIDPPTPASGLGPPWRQHG